MAEGILVTLINLSWQLALIFVVAWLILAAFRVSSASARHIIWLAVVLCPLVLVPMNIISSDVVSMESLLDSFQRATPVQKQMLFIKAGRNVPHYQIVKVMDIAKRADIEKIGFSTIGKQ